MKIFSKTQPPFCPLHLISNIPQDISVFEAKNIFKLIKETENSFVIQANTLLTGITYSIFNIEGKQVISNKPIKQTEKITLDKKGFYLLVISRRGKPIQVLKLVAG